MPTLQDGEGQMTLQINFSETQRPFPMGDDRRTDGTIELNPLRFWTGEGSLTFNSNIYEPSKLMDIGESQVALGAAQSFPYFSLALTQNADRNLFFDNDPGPLTVIVNLIWRPDLDTAWESAFKIEGRLSDVEFIPETSILTVNIEPLLYDVNHGETEGWNNASQRRRNADDAGMEYVNKLNQAIRWPP